MPAIMPGWCCQFDIPRGLGDSDAPKNSKSVAPNDPQEMEDPFCIINSSWINPSCQNQMDWKNGHICANYLRNDLGHSVKTSPWISMNVYILQLGYIPLHQFANATCTQAHNICRLKAYFCLSHVLMWSAVKIYYNCLVYNIEVKYEVIISFGRPVASQCFENAIGSYANPII